MVASRRSLGETWGFISLFAISAFEADDHRQRDGGDDTQGHKDSPGDGVVSWLHPMTVPQEQADEPHNEEEEHRREELVAGHAEKNHRPALGWFLFSNPIT